MRPTAIQQKEGVALKDDPFLSYRTLCVVVVSAGEASRTWTRRIQRTEVVYHSSIYRFLFYDVQMATSLALSLSRTSNMINALSILARHSFRSHVSRTLQPILWNRFDDDHGGQRQSSGCASSGDFCGIGGCQSSWTPRWMDLFHRCTYHTI